MLARAVPGDEEEVLDRLALVHHDELLVRLRAALQDRRARHDGDVLGHHPHLDRGERRAGRNRRWPPRRRARRAGWRGWCAISSSCEGSVKRPVAGGERALHVLGDLRLDLVLRQHDRRRQGRRREVARRPGEVGVVLRDVGRRLDGRAGVGEHLQRVERRHLVGEAGGSGEQRRLDAGEQVVLHHLAVADLGRLGDVEKLLGGDDVDRLDQAVALGKAGLVAAHVLLLRQRRRRRGGEVRFRDRARRRSSSRSARRPSALSISCRRASAPRRDGDRRTCGARRRPRSPARRRARPRGRGGSRRGSG